MLYINRLCLSYKLDALHIRVLPSLFLCASLFMVSLTALSGAYYGNLSVCSARRLISFPLED